MACISDSDYTDAATNQKEAMIAHATADAAIAVAMALWKRNASGSIADMQNEIANRQITLAEQIHDHAKNFWPYEKAAVDDAFGLGKAVAPYDALSTSWASYSDNIHQIYSSALDNALSDKCISLTSCERANWTRNRQKDRAQVIYFADRQAEGRMDALNDVRYAEQYAALGLGREHLADVPSFQAVAGKTGNQARGILLDSIGSAWEAYGFYRRGTDQWGSRIEQRWAEQGIPYRTSSDGWLTGRAGEI